jgi:hypothetical protein
LVRSYHNPANLRVKTEILSARAGKGAERQGQRERNWSP